MTHQGFWDVLGPMFDLQDQKLLRFDMTRARKAWFVRGQLILGPTQGYSTSIQRSWFSYVLVTQTHMPSMDPGSDGEVHATSWPLCLCEAGMPVSHVCLADFGSRLGFEF